MKHILLTLLFHLLIFLHVHASSGEGLEFAEEALSHSDKHMSDMFIAVEECDEGKIDKIKNEIQTFLNDKWKPIAKEYRQKQDIQSCASMVESIYNTSYWTYSKGDDADYKRKGNVPKRANIKHYLNLRGHCKRSIETSYKLSKTEQSRNWPIEFGKPFDPRGCNWKSDKLLLGAWKVINVGELFKNQSKDTTLTFQFNEDGSCILSTNGNIAECLWETHSKHMYMYFEVKNKFKVESGAYSVIGNELVLGQKIASKPSFRLIRE